MAQTGPALHPYFALPRPMLFGHRGASGERPENTLPAFERAVRQGVAALETDVHLTRDGEVVVFHDALLDRTTNGEGPIVELDLADLQKLDAGHRFTADGGQSFPFRGQGIGIPTLRETFDAFPALRINVEIKANTSDLIDATLDLVEPRCELTLLAAAEDDTMQALRAAVEKRGLEPALGASIGDVLGFVRAALGEGPVPEGPMALQIPPQFGDHPLVTPDLLRFARAQGVHVHVWTVNDEAEMKRLLALGVDGLMSDFPARLVRVAGSG
ncbi:MAG: glycerophosphodiester phosphodiesterase [bacterium]|nr:glycerophosphodiester phosphodiesterase [bacterium]MCP5070671.1 glycerophosphodiester phosphodiesterase [bacterium]